MREFHARAARALLSFSVSRVQLVDWKATDLVKLLDVAQRMEMAAVVGSDEQLTAASRAADGAADLDLDEWDKLAADLDRTIPPQP